MKYVLISFLCLLLAVGFVLLGTQNKRKSDEVLRIHIRANSNSEIDQNIKYQIKDKVVEALVPLVSNCQTKQEAEIVMKNSFSLIENVANNVLIANNFDYVCTCKLANEMFPTRNYEDLVFEEGYYDALILNLGKAEGNNWWCVVYPPLCFLQNESKNVVYRSKIVELINKFKNR